MATRRYRTVVAPRGHLLARYGRGDDASPDLQYAWGGGGAQKPDARVLCNAFEEAKVFDGKCLREVLQERGYDITTLKFSIQLLSNSERKDG